MLGFISSTGSHKWRQQQSQRTAARPRRLTRERYERVAERAKADWTQLPPEHARSAMGEDMPGAVMTWAMLPYYSLKGSDGTGSDQKVTEAFATRYLADVLERTKAADPLEEMLVTQAVWTHARVGYLTWKAHYCETFEHLDLVTAAADRASNTFRRLMLALSEYRNPKRGETFAAIKQLQVNAAMQQVVQNDGNLLTRDAKSKTGRRRTKKDRPTRPYCLTPEGLLSLRNSALRVKPWQWTRGPVTPEGKARSSRNALKHGLRSAQAIRERADAADLLRACREMFDAEEDLIEGA